MKEIPTAKKYVPADTNRIFYTIDQNIKYEWKGNANLEEYSEEIHHENTAFMKTKIYDRHVVKLSVNGKKVL
jgi:hypothetical protein